ncbi:RHOMBOID-like protein 9, chloroplastic isoform X4 [Miscanthus floridulus]
MAGVVKWKPASYEQMERTRVALERLSFRSNCAKYHDTRHLGHFVKDDHLICRSLKSISKPKARQYVIVKVHNKDVDEGCSSKDDEIISSPFQRKEGNQLRALESYFSKLNPTQQLYSLPQKKLKSGPSSSNEVDAIIADEDANFKNRVGSLQVQIDRGNTSIKSYQSLLDMRTDDQASGFCLTNLLAAINIAVLLFEIASPVKNSENEYLSLPLLYGAKINNLILSGEWWRLLTPMCLGPVFSLIGAWLVYQSQNKQVIDVSESMFWQAVIAAALSFLLSIFGRIDNWAHLGATISGLFFGYLTCPSVEFDNSAKNGQKEAVVRITRQAHPCKSTAVFFITILAFAILAFAYGTQFNNMDME